LEPLHTPPATAPARSDAPPSSTTQAGEMETALAFLGLGPVHGYNPQADTLEGEVEEYLAAPLKYANAVQFWQVSRKLFSVKSTESN
jgi:hypothetical protein